MPLQDDDFFVSDAATRMITHYGGNDMYLYHEFTMFRINRGCHCCEGSNEACDCIQNVRNFAIKSKLNEWQKKVYTVLVDSLHFKMKLFHFITTCQIRSFNAQ